MKHTIHALLLLGSGLLALAGCGKSSGTTGGDIPEPSGTPPEQLESFAVDGISDGPKTFTDVILQVSGAERDFTITAGTAHIEVHTPTLVDLSVLSGRTATVNVAEAWGSKARAMVISDAKGPLYAVNAGDGLDLVGLFGKKVVRWGDAVATEIIAGDEAKRYRRVVFTGDDGDVSVGAGEVASVVIGGALYRVGVISAFEIEYYSTAEIYCGDRDTLSYEMMRVYATPAVQTVVRPAKMKPLDLGCL